VFDVRRADLPREQFRLELDAPVLDVAVAGNRLALAMGRTGLLVYRLEGGHLRLEGAVAGAAPAYAVEAFGDDVLVAAGGTGLYVVDVASRVSRAAVRLPGSLPVLGIGVEAPLALLALDRYGFGVVDLGDPAAPRVLGPHPRKLEVTFE
jgi:hypothetical protein